MSSFFGLAEQVLSRATGRSSEPEETFQTSGQEYEDPHQSQQPYGDYDTQEVGSYADADDDDDDQGYVANAMQHVQDNSHQVNNEQLDGSGLATYAPMIINALSSLASKSGLDIGSLVSGGLGEDGGNQLMGLVMKAAENSFTGEDGEEKQNFMNGAAMTVAKLLSQNQLSSFVGESNSGGLGGMLEMGKSLLLNRFG